MSVHKFTVIYQACVVGITSAEFKKSLETGSPMWSNYAAILWTSPLFFQFIPVTELEKLGLKEQLLDGPLKVECSEEELNALIEFTLYNPQEILGAAILNGVEILE